MPTIQRIAPNVVDFVFAFHANVGMGGHRDFNKAHANGVF